MILNRSFILRLWLLLLQVRARDNDVREAIISHVIVGIGRSSNSSLALCGDELAGLVMGQVGLPTIFVLLVCILNIDGLLGY